MNNNDIDVSDWNEWPLTEPLPAGTPFAVDCRKCDVTEWGPGVDHYDPRERATTLDPFGCPVIVPPHVPFPEVTGEPTLRELIAGWEYANETGVLGEDEMWDLTVELIEAAKELVP